jgi:hypothetical protein
MMKHLLIASTLWYSFATVVVAAPDAESTRKSSQVASPPASIAADLSRDVTVELNAWLADVPNGATIEFPAGARYRIDDTVLIEGKEDLTIDGKGVFFQCFDPGEDHEKKTSYGGWKRTRSKAHIRITKCKRIQVRDIEVHGAHPDPGRKGTYDDNREAQHGFDLVHLEDCKLENVNVHDVYGDCVYISNATRVVVADSTLKRCGRQGIAVGTANDVLIEDNEIADSRRGIIDVEPYGERWAASNIRIIGNRLGGSRLLLLPMGGSGTLGTVFVADNVNSEPNGTPAVSNRGKRGQGRGPFVMVNNQFTIGGSPAAGLRVKHNEGVLIAGNTLIFPQHRKMTAVDLDGSTGVVVGNHFSEAASVIAEMPDIASLSNTLEKDAAPRPTEWKRILGGFAVRVKLDDGQVVALMRGGPTTVARPAKIEGYEHSTAAEFAWFHVQDGKLINTASRN